MTCLFDAITLVKIAPENRLTMAAMTREPARPSGGATELTYASSPLLGNGNSR